MEDIYKRISDLGFNYEKKEKEYVSSCNFCGNSSFTTISHIDRYGYSAKADLCNTCGLVFLNPRMTIQEYGKFYESYYRPLVSAFHGRVIDRDTIQEEQQQYAVELEAFLKPHMDGFSELLDIGGSTGVVAAHLKERYDLNATCIDPSSDELQYAAGKGLETECCMIEEFDESKKQFDLIIMCQTVDHLLDVKGSLKKIRKLIIDSGAFFIDIVDFRAAYLRNKRVESAVKIDHPFYFIQETMELYLLSCGFKIDAVNYAHDKLHIGFLCRPSDETFFNPGKGTKISNDLKNEIRFIQNYHYSKL